MGPVLGKAARLWDKLKQDGVERKILILGLDAAGKTTVLYKMKLKNGFTTNPTVGFNVETVEPVKGVTFMAWDIGGQNKVRKLWRHYYPDAAGVVFVVDSSDQERLWEARQELHQIMEDSEMKTTPCVVMANKQDMPGALKPHELIDSLDLVALSPNHKWHVQATCAVAGDGICEAMVVLSQFVKANRRTSNAGATDTSKRVDP